MSRRVSKRGAHRGSGGAPKTEGVVRAPRAAQRRTAVLFVACFLGGVAVLATGRILGLEEPAADAVGGWTATVVYQVLQLFQPGMRVAGNLLSTPQGALRVGQECSGFELAGLVGAAMIAYPTVWQRRLAGVLLLIPFVFVINVVRVASLALALEYVPSVFEVLHTIVWQGILILAGLVYWVAWSSGDARSAAPGDVRPT